MKVCFVCLFAYPLLDGAVEGSIGGAEVQAWLFARELAQRADYDVSFAVLDHGQPPVQQMGSVTVYAHPEYSCSKSLKHRIRLQLEELVEGRHGFPWIRIHRFSSRLIWLAPAWLASKVPDAARALVHKSEWVDGIRFLPQRWKLYERIDADVYCCVGVTDVAAELVVFCRRRGKRSLIISASDMDFSASYRQGSTERNLCGMPGGMGHIVLTQSDTIVVQNEDQGRVLGERFGRPATLVRNPIPVESRTASSSEHPRGAFALWIGRSDAIKRPQLCLELARRCPAVRFVMVMNRSDGALHRQITQAGLENVEIIERLPFEAADRLISQATVLVNTSQFEGFPYTFLQAGVHGVPVLTLDVNPDGFITTFQCGDVADGDLDRMANQLDRLFLDRSLAGQYANNIQRYVTSHHRLDQRVDELHAVLKRMQDDNQQPSASTR